MLENTRKKFYALQRNFTAENRSKSGQPKKARHEWTPADCGWSGAACPRRGPRACFSCMDSFYQRMHDTDGQVLMAGINPTERVESNRNRPVPDWEPSTEEYEPEDCDGCLYDCGGRCALNAHGRAQHCKTINLKDIDGTDITVRISKQDIR